MKQNLLLLTGAIVASTVALPIWAQPQPAIELAPVETTANKDGVGPEIRSDVFINVQVKNLQDESLGRIKDLGIDLINGRIVEVLVRSDDSLEVGNKVVAVPPLALLPDGLNQVYRLDISAERFKTAAAIDLSKWEEFGRSARVAATYHLFGQETYFFEEGARASTTDSRPKVPLGYVERASKIVDLPVGNRAGEKFGKVWSLTMDIPKGRIRSVIVLAPGNFLTKSVVPAMALSFNPARDALVLDDTKLEYADEPRFVYTAAAFGQDAYSREESYKGPLTSEVLVQGSSYRDIDQTVHINKEIRAAKLNNRHVEVGTINDRVTLRGWVDTNEDKRRIGAIAIAAARLELVDNQIKVGKPVTND